MIADFFMTSYPVPVWVILVFFSAIFGYVWFLRWSYRNLENRYKNIITNNLTNMKNIIQIQSQVVAELQERIEKFEENKNE